MTVYVLTITAVFDHGCCGVFTSRAAAVAHADNLFAVSDGHHTFRVDAVELDAGYEPSGLLRIVNDDSWIMKRDATQSFVTVVEDSEPLDVWPIPTTRLTDRNAVR